MNQEIERSLTELAKAATRKRTRNSREEALTAIDNYIAQMVGCWSMEGYRERVEMEIDCRVVVGSVLLRDWLKKNRYSVKPGTCHLIDTRWNANPEVRRICWAREGGVGGIRWELREVDQLRNMYIWIDK